MSSDFKTNLTDMVRRKRTITIQSPSQRAHTDKPVDDPGGQWSPFPSQESDFPVEPGGAPETSQTPTLEADMARENKLSHERVLSSKRAVWTPRPVQDRIPIHETAETGRTLSPPPQEKTPILEPRVDKGKQPKRRPDPLRATPLLVPVESSIRRGDPVIQIPEDGQTMVGLLRILKEELLKELKGDIGDLQGSVEAVWQGQVVTKSFGTWLSNWVTAMTEEIHVDIENLFGSIDVLSSDLRGLWQES
jgi:hypothetical protein